MWMGIGIVSLLIFVSLLVYGIVSVFKKNGKAKKLLLGSLAAFVLFVTGVVNGSPASTSGANAQLTPPSSTATSVSSSVETSPVVKGKWVTVSKVVDGDTIEVDNGEKVRLIGVNTPETVKPNTPVQPMGKEASDYTRSQLEGKKVYLETDVQEKDTYGRTLGYVYTNEPKSDADIEKYLFNATIVREGYAQLMTIPPNVKRADMLAKLQQEARASNKGLWTLGIYKDSATSTDDVFAAGKDPSKQLAVNAAPAPAAQNPGTTSGGITAAPSTGKASTVTTETAQPNAPPQAVTANVGVDIVSITSPAHRNATATLAAKVAPNTTASIVVEYKSGPSKAQGLGTKTSDANGNVSWSWKVGGNTTIGSWPVTVSAGGQSATVSLVVQ